MTPSARALSLAREALPCRRKGPWCGDDPDDARVCSDCQRRPIVALAIDRAIATWAARAGIAEAERDAFKDAALALQHELECYIDNCGDEDAALEDLEGLRALLPLPGDASTRGQQ